MLREWEKRHPGRVENIFRALQTVVPSHLMDRQLFDFAGLKATGSPDAGGDLAFDHDPDLPLHGAQPSAVVTLVPRR
jgi:tRNA 2-thiocytidine biosynthesis protein TtcA